MQRVLGCLFILWFYKICGKHKHQEMHSAFYNVLGQIITRMNIQGNHSKKARIHAIGIPYLWRRVFKNKVKKMKYAMVAVEIEDAHDYRKR